MTNGLLDTLNEISTSLATLALQVRAESLAGLGSRSKVAEHMLLPVLRRVCRAPELANANTLAANFPGINLYDPSSGLGVQVTSESTAAKITKTIKTLVDGPLPLTRLVIALNSPRSQWAFRFSRFPSHLLPAVLFPGDSVRVPQSFCRLHRRDSDGIGLSFDPMPPS
jgi:hypothetical protein